MNTVPHKADKSISSVTKLSMIIWHNNFRNLSQAGAAKSSSKQDVPRLSDAFDNAYESLSKLFKRIEVDEDELGEPFTSTIVLINRIIEDAQKIQRSRITREETGDNNSNNGGNGNNKNSAGKKGKSNSDNTGEKADSLNNNFGRLPIKKSVSGAPSSSVHLRNPGAYYNAML
jgi:hypothetical protein